jgi:hypothetical protein
MPVESDGKSRGNPRIYELIEHAPKTGKSTVWAWPQLIDYLKVAGQPVSGPWPPHQEPRPDPDYESGPVAVADPHSAPPARAASPAADSGATQGSATQNRGTHGATAEGGPAEGGTAQGGTA